jgi:hypothetical protein
LSAVEHGRWEVLFFHWQPLAMCPSLIGELAEPTPFALWERVSLPRTARGPFVIVAVFWRQRFPFT